MNTVKVEHFRAGIDACARHTFQSSEILVITRGTHEYDTARIPCQAVREVSGLAPGHGHASLTKALELDRGILLRSQLAHSLNEGHMR